jgi:hypothetical protein
MRRMLFGISVALVTGSACTPARTPEPIVVVETVPRTTPTTDRGGDLAIASSDVGDRDPRDLNVPGTTLGRRSVFVDPSPPKGWTQCAGFVNTADDDVAPNFLDNCLDGNRLRVRVFTADDVLEEDVFVTDIERLASWPEGQYLGRKSTYLKKTHWGGIDGGAQSAFYVHGKGRDACFQQSADTGTTLGSGHAGKAIIAGGGTGYDEYRVSCGGAALPDRKIALYR